MQRSMEGKSSSVCMGCRFCSNSPFGMSGTALVQKGCVWMNVPSLHKLSLNVNNSKEIVFARWKEACGKQPDLKAWHSMRGRDKFRWLHSVAKQADDDSEPDGNYLTAYEEIDIDDLFANKRRWSVEHVVPRSHSNGSGPDRSESDPVGWIEATSSANSRRSNYPLMLWPDADGSIAIPNTLVIFDGVKHYVPPLSQRGRLARKWLFMRATYRYIQSPTASQVQNASKIVALAQHQKAFPAELRVNDWYRKYLGWANPLLEIGCEKWYSDPEWRALIFMS